MAKTESSGNRGILGLFKDSDDAVTAADKLNEEGFHEFEVLSGTPYPEGAFGETDPGHHLYIFPLIGAMLGLSVAILFTAGTQLAYPLITAGKPVLALPPMFIISYEGTMLVAILFTILGVLFESRLPRPKVGLYDPRITDGYIGLLVTAPEDRIGQVESVFKEASADDIKLEETVAD